MRQNCHFICPWLGAVVGSESFKHKYIQEKIAKWTQDLEELSKIAEDEPQVALSAYNKGICHRWSFVQRTVGGISSLFTPLEECIKETFLPAVIGRKISPLERKYLSLPVRFRGLGVTNSVENCDREPDWKVGQKTPRSRVPGFTTWCAIGAHIYWINEGLVRIQTE